MPALVPDLVNMASDPSVATGDLLRRALVVASRLNVPDLVAWINRELNGYGTDEVPDYRVLRGQLKSVNPVRGLVPLQMPAELADELSVAPIVQSIPELERLAQADHAIAYLQPGLEEQLMSMMSYPMRPVIKLSSVAIHGVVERVRSRVLEWALDLEGRGVLGEGMVFTQQEKQMVQQIHNHFGDVSSSQIQIGSDGSTQTQTNTTSGIDLAALQGLVAALGDVFNHTNGETADELRAELATLKAQAASPKPKWEVIKATARSIKTVAEGAAGNILATLAQPHLATLLALATK